MVDPMATLVYDLKRIAVQPYPAALLKLIRQFLRAQIVPLHEHTNPFEAHGEFAICVVLNGDTDDEIDRQGGCEKSETGNSREPQRQLRSDGKIFQVSLPVCKR